MVLKSLPISLFTALLALGTASAATTGAPVDFNRDVRPIFAANCLKCHGIDEGSRKAKLRLDDRESAIAPLKGGDRAIVPGKPDESELVRRVFSDDDDEVMPPAKTQMKLTADQKNTLRQWISEGAAYEIHWAFVAPKQSPLPAVKQADWPRNPIDRFVLARLEGLGLHPSPEADKYELVRRVSLDLVGLPPTPQEADAFANDTAPDAYEKLVDRLLASPHYGERWARRWLDLARYADTNGFEKDRPRIIWPYRDWVINALNADMPFDQFTVDQLAGDMLPDATAEQKIATGFHRNTMLNEEGGIDPNEYRFLAVVDRVSTTGTAWLGLTVGCAQCHTHKYDPITHKDYYRLMAFLDNADEPQLEVPSAENTERRKEIEGKLAELTAQLPEKFPPAGPVDWQTPPATVTTQGGSTPEPAEDGAWRFTGKSPETDTYQFQFDTGPGPIDRIRIETLKDGNTGPGRTPHGNFVLSELTVSASPKDSPAPADSPAAGVRLVRAEADFSQKGFPVGGAIDGNPQTGWAIDPANKQPIVGRSARFFFEKPIQFANGTHWTVTLSQQYGKQHTIAKLRLSVGSARGQVPDDRPLAERRREALDNAFAEWQERESAKAVSWTALRPDQLESSKPYLTLLDDQSVLAGGDVAKSVTYDLTYHPTAGNFTAVRLEVLPDDSLPGHGPGMTFYEGQLGDFFLSEVSLEADGKPAKFSRAAQDFGSPASAAIDGDPQTGWSIANGEGKPHVAVFSLAEPTGAARELKLHLLCERYHAAPLGRFRVSVTTDPRAAGAEALEPDVEAALATPAGQRSESQRALLLRHFLSITPELAEARKEIDALRATLPAPTTTLVMRERPAGHSRQTFLHHRGEFLSPEEQVEPGVPSFLPPLPAGAPANRLTLARWLVSADNPLTARVQVNRQWAAFFGRGIVRTLQDFGYQGEMPSNPQLLDWLAVEFMKGSPQAGSTGSPRAGTGLVFGPWSFKALDRLIVTSAAYRQASGVTPELQARDPDNALIARGPRVRLEAELIRDSALKASGLLSEKIGGPSVFPPQPASVTTEGAYGKLAWNTSTGEDRYRRSLYTFTKRTAPFALFNTFDAPSGEACVARREVSDSPLQALSLLNDTVFVEAAQALGTRLAEAPSSDESRASEAFRRCLVRPPEKDELAMLVAFARQQRQRLADKELDADGIAGPGTGDAIERATWTTVARAVMNLDEAVTKQ
jgi:hypothetical protein